ncbi:hypothetical protein MPTA5024_02200 [Microbispora sp. ATCC PTA-5024]|nr:hypothetical protein MPTA5024_02200 [Microbispora sp. ATCC PTA-5024]
MTAISRPPAGPSQRTTDSPVRVEKTVSSRPVTVAPTPW